MSKIPSLYAEGLVYLDGPLLFAERDGQVESVDFTPFEGMEVYALISHLMSDTRKGWGLGSCALEPTGSCPFGHHLHPWKMSVMFGTGILQKSGDWWEIPGLRFPPVDHLVGHRCKVFMFPMVMAHPTTSADREDALRMLGEMLTNLKKPQ